MMLFPCLIGQGVCVWSSLIILLLGVGGAKYKFLSCDFDIRDDPASAPRERQRQTGAMFAGTDTWSQTGEEREVVGQGGR